MGRTAALTVAIVVCSSVCRAQDGADAGTAQPDGGTGVLTRTPMLLKQVEARFPPEAADAGVAGVVEMEVEIGPSGRVTDAKVVGPAGHGFDEAALEAVKQFEFSPAEVDGVPAAVRIQYRYEFLYRAQVVEKPIAADVVNFAGTLVERGRRDPLEGAMVVVRGPDGDLQATSDAKGHFEMVGVPAGTWPVLVSATDYTRYEVTETFRPDTRTEVTYFVRKKFYSAYETVVRADRERKEVTEVTLKQEEIRLIPGTQGDAFKVVENLPGVARSPFNIGLLVVRGGKPWDTRVYVDDTLVPLLFHFGGLYATFNSNLLEDISFEAGNFGVEYGRSLGGLVRGTTRTPSQTGVHGYVDINLIDSSALVEAPINDDWSIAAGGRRSYIDVVLPLVIQLFAPSANALTFTTLPRYYDYQLKLERKPKGSRDRLSIEFFGSNDRIGFALKNPAIDPEGRANFDTLLSYNRFAVNWDHWLTPHLKLISHNSVGFEDNSLSGGTDLYFRTHTYPVSLREAFEWELPEHGLTLNFGTDVLTLPFSYVAQGPPPFKLNEIPDPFLSQQLIYEALSNTDVEPALYLEAVWKPLPGLKLIPGIRADYSTLMQKGWVDPRFSAFYQLFDHTVLKGGVGLFHQPPDYRVGELSPKFGNPNLLPEAAAHYSVGVEQKFTEAIGLDVQLYYKSLFHQAYPTLGASSTSGDLQPSYVSTGLGRSYGMELLLRHQLTKNFFGWIAYSLSKSERIYPGTNTWALHPLDQPHNLIVIASYKLPYDFIAGVRVRYASGALDTPYLGAIYDANGNYYYPLIGPLFSHRLPPFFQLDARIDKRFVFNRWMLSFYADVQNVTNRQNVEGVAYNFNYTAHTYVYGIPILPALGMRGEF